MEKQNWYAAAPKNKEPFMARVRAINEYRSPETRADEILRLLGWVVTPLLASWCMVISFASYTAMFSHTFGTMVSWIGAGTLCLVIELGKLKLGSYAFQKPFLEGWEGIKTEGAEAAVWIGVILFAVAAFIMSAINSTAGAHIMTRMEGAKVHDVAFVANTSDLDAQIKAANDRILEHSKIKWKGTVTYQAQKAIERETKTIQQLTTAKENALNGQRADFEHTRAQNAEFTNTGANWMMAAGGWVELLQILVLFIRAACMRILSNVMDREQHQQRQTSGFNQFSTTPSYKSTANGQHQNQVTMFNRQQDGNVRSSLTVPQSTPTVPQTNTAAGSDQVLLWCKDTVQKNLPHFERKDADNHSVANRIHSAFDKAVESIHAPGFNPSAKVVDDFINFLQNKAIPVMNQYGKPYQNLAAFNKLTSAAMV